MLMLTVLPAIKFVWWQGCVLPWVESVWWQDTRSGIIIPFQCCQANFVHIGRHHCGLVHRIEVKFQNGHSDGEVGGRTSSSSYYDAVLCSKSRLLHSIGKKIKNKNKQNKQKKNMTGYSPGSEVLTTLNRLSVTRSWNFGSTWANGDFSRNVQHRRWFVILDLFLRTRTGKSSVNIEGDLSFLTYFSEPEPERVPCPTAVGGGGYTRY